MMADIISAALSDTTQETRYQQLADHLAEAIQRGTLLPGTRLPSVRRSAQDHHVSINTVVAAYRCFTQTLGFTAWNSIPSVHPIARCGD